MEDTRTNSQGGNELGGLRQEGLLQEEVEEEEVEEEEEEEEEEKEEKEAIECLLGKSNIVETIFSRFNKKKKIFMGRIFAKGITDICYTDTCFN